MEINKSKESIKLVKKNISFSNNLSIACFVCISKLDDKKSDIVNKKKDKRKIIILLNVLIYFSSNYNNAITKK